jgi:hypothetical protein
VSRARSCDRVESICNAANARVALFLDGSTGDNLVDMQQVFPFSGLKDADLVVDAIYESGTKGHSADDPLDPLLGCGNQGGFRTVGGGPPNTKLVVLYSSMNDPDWPDFLDLEQGTFTYFGDNKRPGGTLEGTARGGNKLLRYGFDSVHSNRRKLVPPIFVFTKAGTRRDVVFRGIVVPSVAGLPGDDLVAVWRSTAGARFQNYRAIFTVLDIQVVPRSWIKDVQASAPFSAGAPAEWRAWVEHGKYASLRATPTIKHRKPNDQIGMTADHRKLVECVYEYFKDDPYAFEACAGEIARRMDSRIEVSEFTRAYRDGGRDAIGFYHLGPKGDRIAIDFALEAKCKGTGSGVGVKELSRLISRLRHRQFGILVTTSFLAEQAYKELRDDQHPVIVIAAKDIAQILVDSGLNTETVVQNWLNENFPVKERKSVHSAGKL